MSTKLLVLVILAVAVSAVISEPTDQLNKPYYTRDGTELHVAASDDPIANDPQFYTGGSRVPGKLTKINGNELTSDQKWERFREKVLAMIKKMGDPANFLLAGKRPMPPT